MPPETNTPNSDSDATKQQKESPQFQASNEPEPKKITTDPDGEKTISQSQSPLSLYLKSPIWQTLSTVSIAVFAFFLVVNSWGQWRATRDATEAAKMSATAALEMAKTAEEANKLAKEISLLHARPWVGGRAKAANVVVGLRPTILFSYENYGNSPAIAVRSKSHLVLIHGKTNASGDRDVVGDIDGTTIVEYLEPQPFHQIGTLFPGEIFASPVTLKRGLSVQDMDYIKAGKMKLLGLGEITYQDSTGEQHHTWIAQVYNPEPNEMTLIKPADLPPDD